MRTFAALLLDSYRELNSRKLFWVVLALSAVFVVVYASIGFDQRGMFIFFGLKHFESDLLTEGSLMAKLLYRGIFATFVVPIWLAWIATILALISTAPIFPEFISGGAIDLVLCKPISRMKLFLSKYIASLLFVVLQVTIFTVGVFLAMGWRLNDWEWKVFIAIPLVTLFFSYLYSFCVLIGVLTRSTMAALLLTLLMWFSIYALAATEGVVKMIRTSLQIETESSNRRVSQPEGAAPDAQHQKQIETIASLDAWANRVEWIRMPLPKTSETIELMDRMLAREGDINLMDLITGRVMVMPDGTPMKERTSRQDEQVQERLRQEADEVRPVYILGTSIAFELVMLSIAGWIFCRRDF